MRELLPDTISTRPLPIPSFCAKRVTSALLARPSTGAAPTFTLRALLYQPTIPGREERGMTLTVMSVPAVFDLGGAFFTVAAPLPDP